jgi:hypothetical protein
MNPAPFGNRHKGRLNESLLTRLVQALGQDRAIGGDTAHNCARRYLGPVHP